MTKRDALKLLRLHGWYQLPGKSTSHRKYRHPDKPGCIMLSVTRLGDTMTPGAWRGFLRDLYGRKR